MAKSKPNGPGVSVQTTGKTAVAKTMTPAIGRKGRRSSRKGGR